LPALDRTDIDLVTIDPAGSEDLDQAMCLTKRAGGGYRVYYAIADVASFVPRGGPLEAETWVRGQTVYLPDGKVPLHPVVLSEGLVSLLPGQDRSAVLWTIDLDSDGEITSARVERARVRSRAQLEYVGVQADAHAQRLPEPIVLLPEVGELLIARGLARGSINLPSPEQEVSPDGDGWRLELRQPLRTEEHNAQISLITGIAAAGIMTKGRVGLLRTMPPPRQDQVDRLKVAAASLGIDWPQGATVGQVLATVSVGVPRGAAFVDHAAELLHGAGYTAFDGEVPAQPVHAGVAAIYAHVTAPLRRLADRYATEACLALFAGQEVPGWVREALPKLPEVMSATDRIAHGAERAAVDLTEAMTLAGRVGEAFEAAVIDVDNPTRTHPKGAPVDAPLVVGAPQGGTVVVDDPAVKARCLGHDLPLGDRVTVRLAVADPAKRLVQFAYP
jgi:exoribonuclease R